MIIKNYLTGEEVFFSKSRGGRPHNFAQDEKQDISADKCPFCPENEFMVPKKLYTGKKGYVRVVLNKYPFLEKNEDLFSSHEVVIDTNSHTEQLTDYTPDHTAEVMEVLKERQTQLESNPEVEYVQIFKNNGASAGASQPHSHWQIAAMPIVPQRIERIDKSFKKFKNENGFFYFSAVEDKFIISQTKYFKLFCPNDSKYAYEIDIAAKEHFSSLKHIDRDVLADLGSAVQLAALKLTALCGKTAFNICFYSAPAKKSSNSDFEFFVQIIPRIGNMAGFEFSSGCFINSVYPEDAAKLYRECEV